MPVLTLFFLLLCIPSLTFSHNDRTGDDLPPLPLGKRAMMNNVPAIGYYDPYANGGSMLTVSSLSLLFRVLNLDRSPASERNFPSRPRRTNQYRPIW